MSAEECEMAKALAGCRFVPGTHAKRFARVIAERADESDPQISEKEAAYLRSSVYTFRRQIPHNIVTLAGDVPTQRRDYHTLQAWRAREVAKKEGAAALMSDGYRKPEASSVAEANLDLFPTARVVDEFERSAGQ